jgi:hypothetical protein
MTVDPMKSRGGTLSDAEQGGFRRDDVFLELDSAGDESGVEEREMDERELVRQDQEGRGRWDVTIVQDWVVTSHRATPAGGPSEWSVSGPT